MCTLQMQKSTWETWLQMIYIIFHPRDKIFEDIKQSIGVIKESHYKKRKQ